MLIEIMAAAGIALAPGLFAGPALNDGESWPTLNGDVMRSGFHPRFPAGPLVPAWRNELWQELTGPRAQVIAGEGLAFMGSYAGRMYAWDMETGDERWTIETAGPIMHSPALDGGMLYFGSMDRLLRAVDAVTGEERWRFKADEGISASPVVFGGCVMFGARDGVFHAVDAKSGEMIWSSRTGDRILNSASICEDGRRVIFASEDMHVYCLDLASGREIWKSPKLYGLSVRDYFPVVARGLVFVTTNPVRDFHATLDAHQEMLVRWSGYVGDDPRHMPGSKDDIAKEQERIVEYLKENPSERTFHAFRVEDGSEPWIAPVLYMGGLHNPITPPCHNPRTGDLFLQVRSAYGIWDGGGEVRPFSGFGKLDLQSGRIELLEHAYEAKEPGRAAGANDMPWMTFNYIGDETQSLSCSPDMLLNTHQGFIGAFDFSTRLTSRLYGKRDTYGGFYGPGTFGWEHEGGIGRARAAGQPFGLVNEWHGPARAIVSTAGGRVFYHVGSQVICLKPQP